MRIARCGYFDLGYGIADFGLERQRTEAFEFGMGNAEIGMKGYGVIGLQLGFIGDVVEFLDRQGIDISPQTDGGSLLRSPDDTDRAGHVVEQLDLTIVLFQNFSNSSGGPFFLVGNLRVHMEVPASLGEPLVKLRIIFFHIWKTVNLER